ncbi:hypothetical protein E2562_002532 [Oryza meyeriana var. granulata]|uniref:Uncharacterized protein n=1 Tax=Oryza meyeriana var. granulata TaxID=110450 RepID=A0A6G1F2T5_9ORYZ|nr:hypothetical protein E2562_002532 [Oryza meyeriana var. granulata]
MGAMADEFTRQMGNVAEPYPKPAVAWLIWWPFNFLQTPKEIDRSSSTASLPWVDELLRCFYPSNKANKADTS